MAWQTPKTNWGQPGQTVPGATDFNRIEGNTQYLKDEIDTRMQVISEITYYVNASSGNDNNNGTSSGTAFKTINKAIQVAQKQIAASITINIAAGTYVEIVSIKNMLCNYLNLNCTTNVHINGRIEVDNANRVKIYRANINATNSYYGILAENVRKLDISRISITGATMGISLSNIEMVNIDGDSISGGECIRANTVGNLRVKDVTLSAAAAAAIFLMDCTFAYTSGLKGSIGSVPVHSVSGSILIKGASTIVGGADTKSSGGQIFEQE
ncbi:MAG: hypothetical protein GXY94_01935 [Bacteroidales bacterium]|nr:hypothetical protein [Bacteroidales bacterium]